MATKKTEENLNEEKLQEETAAEPAVKDAWSEEVELLVPRKPKGEDQQYYICVNDRRFSVPANGKMQKLPKPVAEVLLASLEAELEADNFADHMPNETTLNGAVVI